MAAVLNAERLEVSVDGLTLSPDPEERPGAEGAPLVPPPPSPPGAGRGPGAAGKQPDPGEAAAGGAAEEARRLEQRWGFGLEELYGLALRFFKEKDGKAFHPTYEEKLKLVALHKQVLMGPYNPDTCPEVGFFDVLGNDRRREWAALGNMSKEDAMVEFVKLLNRCCHLFSTYVASHKIEKEEQEKKRLESLPAIAAPSMWTRPQIKDFKEKIRQDADSVITVGRGEVVTVRVPTHEEGSYLFWEFATDNYDIGFGVYFEWTDSPNTAVSVHVSESSDDDEEEEENVSSEEKARKHAAKPLLDEIVPVYRRDCHEEVYAGSHQYPGKGVYLLKFDNSYSLWRSKSVYYRVYYTR
ncbi:Golgi resident protein GCP60 [Leptonychotes weddellii]|uniref:Golgi resident protein GCP60 n=1 Tax=Leptonychotes weddellii TaxID=9713 RepID=A0A7F8Q7E2_LEPWE|nr:Golgi resident protein GCP60 [Leptonychotes weddellii]